jgi:hypothetical protein
MGDVTRAGDQARRSGTMRTAARVGLLAFGLVHLLIAWISVQVAWGDSGEASSQGALHALADQPLGSALLWIVAAGLAALAVWQLLTAVWDHRSTFDDAHRTLRRLSALGRAVVYAVIGVTAARTASGSTGTSEDARGEGLTADLLSAPAGRVLVAAIGLAIVGVAVAHVRRGVTDDFTHDLQAGAMTGASRSAVLLVGRVGYVGKGAAIGVVGVLFGWAALTYDAVKAGGLDDALKTVRDQPYGPWLLTLVAVGFAAFGLFCLAWARYVRTR